MDVFDEDIENEQENTIGFGGNVSGVLEPEHKTTARVPARKPLDYPFRPTILKGVDNESVKARIAEEEDSKAYLYKDTKGNITIGIGLMLPNLAAAKALPLTIDDASVPSGRRRATDMEIERGFNKVRVKPYGQGVKAETFNPKNDETLDKLELGETDSDRLLDERLRVDASRLRTEFAGFDKFSASRQQTILDMRFNMGSTKLNARKWPEFYAAIRVGDWDKAARESHRLDIGEQRNTNTAKSLRGEM